LRIAPDGKRKLVTRKLDRLACASNRECTSFPAELLGDQTLGHCTNGSEACVANTVQAYRLPQGFQLAAQDKQLRERTKLKLQRPDRDGCWLRASERLSYLIKCLKASENLRFAGQVVISAG
jgi:hypothetical protein